MCRYAFKTYKTHFVCFECRKQFKRPSSEEVFARRGTVGVWRKLWAANSNETRRARIEQETGKTLDGMEREYQTTVGRCPQCGKPMADLGRDFKPPRATALRAWERLRTTVRLGHAWHTCGCEGPGFVPRDATEYALYLTQRLEHFHAMIEYAKRAQDPPARAAAIRHWSELARDVERERARRGTKARRSQASTRR